MPVDAKTQRDSLKVDHRDLFAPAGFRTVTIAASGTQSYDFVALYGHGAVRLEVYVPTSASDVVKVGSTSAGVAAGFYGEAEPGVPYVINGHVTRVHLVNVDSSNAVDVRLTPTWWPYELPADMDTPWLTGA